MIYLCQVQDTVLPDTQYLYNKSMSILTFFMPGVS